MYIPQRIPALNSCRPIRILRIASWRAKTIPIKNEYVDRSGATRLTNIKFLRIPVNASSFVRPSKNSGHMPAIQAMVNTSGQNPPARPFLFLVIQIYEYPMIPAHKYAFKNHHSLLYSHVAPTKFKMNWLILKFSNAWHITTSAQ